MVNYMMEMQVNSLVGNGADVLSDVCRPSITPNKEVCRGFWVIGQLTTLRAVSDKHTNQEWWGPDTPQASTHKHTASVCDAGFGQSFWTDVCLLGHRVGKTFCSLNKCSNSDYQHHNPHIKRNTPTHTHTPTINKQHLRWAVDKLNTNKLNPVNVQM